MKKAVIIGGGVSGIAAEKLLNKHHWSTLIVSDDNCKKLPEADLIIASPGVPPLTSKLYQQAAASGIEFIGELELGFRYWKRPILAITGTNGKTTTTALTTHLLQKCKVNAASAGNIGLPLCELALDDSIDAAVVEVSNFQLELAPEFAPDCALLLNIQSDHIDRYADGFAGYCAVKKKIFTHVAPENSVWGLSFAEYDNLRRVTVKDETLFIDGKAILHQDETDLPGIPNAENLAGAVELILRFDENLIFSDLTRFIDAVKSFKRAPHRIEKIGSANGLTFVNDSKGTNPAAVIAALDAVRTPVVIMLGGLAKGMDFTILQERKEKIRHAVFFGQDREEIKAALAGCFPMIDTGMDFTAAFNAAVKAAHPGDTVLLSPGCASMDMFKNYKERGEKFRQLVQEFIQA